MSADNFIVHPTPQNIGLASSQITNGTGAPTAAPADPTSAAIYYDQNGTQYTWSITNQSWS